MLVGIVLKYSPRALVRVVTAEATNAFTAQNPDNVPHRLSTTSTLPVPLVQALSQSDSQTIVSKRLPPAAPASSPPCQSVQSVVGVRDLVSSTANRCCNRAFPCSSRPRWAGTAS